MAKGVIAVNQGVGGGRHLGITLEMIYRQPEQFSNPAVINAFGLSEAPLAFQRWCWQCRSCSLRQQQDINWSPPVTFY